MAKNIKTIFTAVFLLVPYISAFCPNGAAMNNQDSSNTKVLRKYGDLPSQTKRRDLRHKNSATPMGSRSRIHSPSHSRHNSTDFEVVFAGEKGQERGTTEEKEINLKKKVENIKKSLISLSRDSSPRGSPIEGRSRANSTSTFRLEKLENDLEQLKNQTRNSSPLTKGKSISRVDSEKKIETQLSSLSETTEDSAKRVSPMRDLDARNDLAILYLTGEGGVLKDEKKAFELLFSAAQENHAVGLYNLGRAFMKGIGTQKDEQKACIAYEKAANLGSIIAQYTLALCYMTNQGVSKNYERTYELLQSVAESVPLYDPISLSSMDMNDETLSKHKVIAFEQADRAVASRLPETLAFLGLIYLDGMETERDTNKAKKCFELSAKFGNLEAKILNDNFEEAIRCCSSVVSDQ